MHFSWEPCPAGHLFAFRVASSPGCRGRGARLQARMTRPHCPNAAGPLATSAQAYGRTPPLLALELSAAEVLSPGRGAWGAAAEQKSPAGTGRCFAYPLKGPKGWSSGRCLAGLREPLAAQEVTVEGWGALGKKVSRRPHRRAQVGTMEGFFCQPHQCRASFGRRGLIEPAAARRTSPLNGVQ